MRDAQRCGLGETGCLGSTAAAARFDEGVCLLEQLLVEAIASLRWQTSGDAVARPRPWEGSSSHRAGGRVITALPARGSKPVD
ncbi:hypothetical protein GCM10010350_81150 [Streptomyces galilaeus]|nr:hypothetical protein GCM10010350_81150 [Streptomyces galilaeus]